MMPSTMIIGLTGNIGSGKDTVADELVRQFGFIKMAFADSVRSDLCEMFRTPESYFSDRSLKEQQIGRLSLSNCTDKEFVDFALAKLGGSTYAQLDQPRSPRWLMRTYGTDYRRAQNPNYWVNRLNEKLQSLPPGPSVVVSDVRFNNEAEMIRQAGFTQRELWQIIRPNNPHFSKSLHPSDAGLSHIEFSRTIINSGTVKQLLRKVHRSLSISEKSSM